jgi:hypothetical protein
MIELPCEATNPDEVWGGARRPELLAPPEKICGRPGIGAPGVAVADVGGEELEEASARVLPFRLYRRTGSSLEKSRDRIPSTPYQGR